MPLDDIKTAQDYFQSNNFEAARLLLGKLHTAYPDNIQILGMLATANSRLGHNEAAIHYYNQLIAIKPDAANAYDRLGVIYMNSHDIDQARECFSRALLLQPDHAAALFHTGLLHRKQQRLNDAEKYFLRAHVVDKRNPEIMKQLGDLSRYHNKLAEAAEYYKRSITIYPNFIKGYYALAQLYSSCGQISNAKNTYTAALSHDPNHLPSISSLGGLYLEQGNHTKAVNLFKKALKLKPTALGARTFLISALNYYSTDRPLIFSAHKEWGNIHTSRLNRFSNHGNSPVFDRKLRIGYVSPDFRNHSVAFFIEPILEHHNRSQYQIYAYSNVENPDERTAKISRMVDIWRPVFGMPDSQLANLIKSDRIDILIDLAGHTAQSRLLVFGMKPAPVQVTYLGYPNTTGIAAIDYRITDRIADPPGSGDEYYTESLARLPGGFLSYKPPRHSPDIHAPPVNKKGYITFGSFNNLAKITPEVIETWALILKEVPRSRLVIKRSSDIPTQNRCIELFMKAGITRERLDFIGWVPGIKQHLDMYNRIDIALDTFPYNGTTTTCESIWMGVPVLTLSGSMHAGRVGMSLLTQVELANFIAADKQDYVRLAKQWAYDIEGLANLRETLRERFHGSSLCDGKTFTSNLETLYRAMWQTWCASKSDKC